MEGVLLEEAQTDYSGNFQSQLLVIRENITSDQLNDLHEGAFLVQDSHELISVCYKFGRDMFSVPGGQIFQIFAVAGEPVDSREMAGISQCLVQSPEAADESLGILGNRL